MRYGNVVRSMTLLMALTTPLIVSGCAGTEAPIVSGSFCNLYYSTRYTAAELKALSPATVRTIVKNEKLYEANCR